MGCSPMPNSRRAGQGLLRLQRLRRRLPERRAGHPHQPSGGDAEGLPGCRGRVRDVVPDAVPAEPLLQHPRRYAHDPGPDRRVLLLFVAAPANPLLGSWVVDSFESAPNTVSVPLPGTELTAVFNFTKVAGFAGCNSYTGPYTTNGDVAAIGPLATTRAPAPRTSWPRRRLPRRAPGRRSGRAPGSDPPSPGSQRQHRRRAGQAHGPRAVAEPERRRRPRPPHRPSPSPARPRRRGRGRLRHRRPTPTRRRPPRRRLRPRRRRQQHAGTDRPAARVAPADRDLHRGRDHDGDDAATIVYPADLAHRRSAARPGLPLLRPEPDHGPGRPATLTTAVMISRT